ncbi:hypothetical protein GURASL_11750 [Geotalea uraniireducens]|uniref:YhdP central domain-containing protein n=1 Tax=Geotalea uraniireducens TaxID=351604 RepID=A0ABN6VVP3_9BACT|nr:AsmA-like C-terminal domain-containing protein [Geotalea uraniireducens]BDV42252.1 hypothetical protein GURASL_11750 [Geotalea uraniireducens]
MLAKTGKVLLIAILLIVVVIAGSVAVILFSRLHEIDTYKEQILAEVEQTLHRRVTYEKGNLSFSFGPAFTFTKVTIKERDGRADFATADRLSFRIALLPLLDKRVIIKQLVVEQPTIRLSRDRDGRFNISDLLEEQQQPPALKFRLKGIRLIDGRIVVTDHAAVTTGLTTIFDRTNLTISRLVRGRESDVELSTTVLEGKTRSSVALRGTVTLPRADKPLTGTHFAVKVLARGIDTPYYWPYYARYVPFQRPAGRLDLDASFNGTGAEFTSHGALRLVGLRFAYPEVFHATLAPREIRATYELSRSAREVAVTALDYQMDGLHIKGSCAIKDIGSGDPRIVARTTIAPFRLEEFFHYIPFGIIATDASQFIERNIKGGLFRVDDGRLDGRVSQILHMERDQNYNVLSVHAHALGGAIVDIGGGVPPFNGIKGELLLEGKNFVLKEMSGKCGNTPFTLNGMISDYPLDTPSGYPFSAVFTPQQSELVWLLGKAQGSKLHFSGKSVLHLTGQGTTAAYALAGDWDLKEAGYSLTDTIAKPAQMANTLSFKLSLGKEKPTDVSCQYNLPPLALAVAAHRRPGGKVPFQLDLRSNPFQMAAIAPLLPRAKPYAPQGIMQITAHGEGATATPTDLSWTGSLLLNGAAVRFTEQMKPLSNITGTVRFKGKSLETPRLAMHLGQSLIYGRGSVTDFDHPSFNADFSSPLLDLADLGIVSAKGPVRVQRLQGHLAYRDDTLQIRALSGKINDTVLNLKGTVTDPRTPRLDLTVNSPHLDIGDILLLTELERSGTNGKAPAVTSLRATINAESGRFAKLDFKKLHTVAMYEEHILYLEPLEFTAYGGTIAGRVRADFGSNGHPRYQTSLKADKVDAEQLIQSLGLKIHNEIVTGTLSLQADVTAKGGTMAELKKSLLGNVKLQMERGKLRKFSTLSKIFSILNVSQLLKFQLPDMVADGMPYNKVTGTLAVRDGIVSSNDFFIDSNAMNISAVGKIDLPREEIDATIGVQPLQTVDKVVNRIPIVGWILTGREKHFITTYFEAKGKLTDPTVTAIPVSSIARGVFDIFKRVFQLPAKLITDTGEVIIGK